MHSATKFQHEFGRSNTKEMTMMMIAEAIKYRLKVGAGTN
jgi:hypothetical protein